MKKEWLGLAILSTIALSELAFSRPQRLRIGSLQKWRCQEKGCNKRFQDGFLVDIDHIIPLEKGGKDIISNGQVLCLESHARKHEKAGELEAARLIRLRLNATGGRTMKWKQLHKK